MDGTDPAPATEARPRTVRVVDVARAAGVSHQTVSRVLNDHPSLRPATRQKVLDTIASLGYRPNAAARALSSKRSRMLGILSTSRGEYGPAASITAVETASRAAGYSVTIASAQGDVRGSIDDAIDHLVALAPEGIIVVAPQKHSMDALSERALDIPFVSLHAHADSSVATPIDQLLGARLASDHLIELGHKTIGHISGPLDWLDSAQRVDGFRHALADAGLDTACVVVGDWSAQSGFAAGRQLIDMGVTAIFAANDQMALGALSAAGSVGRRVPSDLSIVGFDDMPEAPFYQPALTTVRQDFATAGRSAVALMLGIADELRTVEPVLIVRDSTSAPT